MEGLIDFKFHQLDFLKFVFFIDFFNFFDVFKF